jgi:hypothetical protein
MIKPLMRVIRENVTWGVTALPLKRNLVSRFMKERSTRNDERYIDRRERRILRPLKGGKLLGFSYNFSFHARGK